MDWDLNEPHGKKTRKHKRKKHKHRYDNDDDDVSEKLKSPPVKLKIKIGGKTLAESVVVSGPAAGAESVTDDVDEQSVSSTDVSVGRGGGSKLTESDEEEAWLDAIESGTLDEYERERRNRKALTSRQKALIAKRKDRGKQFGDDFVTFPIKGSSKKATETIESLEKKALRAEKRREQATEKREKDKKETMDRLLKKQDSKIKLTSQKPVDVKKVDPSNTIKYIDSLAQKLLCFPADLPPYLLKTRTRVPSPTSVTCAIDGCKNAKKYSCSKTGAPLCSLECYKLNQLQQKLL